MKKTAFSLNKYKTNFIVQKVSVRANHVGDVATVMLIYSFKPHPRVSYSSVRILSSLSACIRLPLPLRAESCEAVRSLSSHKFSQSPS